MSSSQSAIDGWALTKVTASCFVFGTVVLGLLVYSIHDKWVPVGDGYVLMYPSRISSLASDEEVDLQHPERIEPKPSSSCQGIPVPGNFTMVTSLYDIKDWSPNFQFGYRQFLVFAARVLSLNVHMVVYCEKKFETFVKYHRKSMRNYTVIITRDVEHLDYYKYYSEIKSIMDTGQSQLDVAYTHKPSLVSPVYHIISNSKVSLLAEAVDSNHFRVPYMYWIDSAYGYGLNVLPNSCKWAPKNTFQEKISLLMSNKDPHSIQSITDVYGQSQDPYFHGGFFGGSITAVKKMNALHHSVFKSDFLDEHRVDSVETLLADCYLKQPTLFNPVVGSYFNAFELFN